jgi:tetratricopeptide (TPR) repeat protein
MIVYDAFISYNHSKDSAVATRLQGLMQRLGKPWYVRRAIRVFRDDTSLSATPHLWPSIEEALKASRYLVLIASPEAAASRWVFQETQFWIENKSADTLLLALSAGELQWNSSTNDFDWSATTPLPPSLKGAFKHEPKWIDLRAFRDSPHGSAAELLAAADLAAAIRGVPKEDLLSEEVRQHRRAMMLTSLAAVCLFFLTIAAAWEWRSAIAQRDRAENILLTTVQGANDLVLDFAVRLRQTLGIPTAMVDEFLKKIGGIQEGLVKFDAPSLELRRAQAVTLRAQSQALWVEGEYGQALDKAQQSTKTLQGVITPDSRDVALNFELSHSLDREGEALAALGRHQDARDRFQHSLTIRQLLAQSAEDRPGSAQANQRQRDLAVAYERTGDEHYALQKYDEASDMYGSSLKIRDGLSKAKPDDPDLLEDLAVGHDRIARIDQRNGDDPIDEFKLSIAIREKLVAQNPLNSNWQQNLAIDDEAVGLTLIRRDDCAEAAEPLQSAMKIDQLLVDRNPDVPRWQGDLAATLFYLAQCNDQPRERLQQAIDIVTKLENDGKLPSNVSGLRALAQSRLSAMSQ